ncbi:hypothetical protein [Vibrio phage vB_VnaS-AQKL99]|nr:hypothetical protein [Vibrio phage vB_VnaS-AQKL99]
MKWKCHTSDTLSTKSWAMARNLSNKESKMTGRIVDLTGQRFGHIIVLRRGDKVHPGGARGWIVQCDCGNVVDKDSRAVKGGKFCARNCSLRKSNYKHGHAVNGQLNSGAYRSWLAMRARCLNPSNTRFADYGGRGITICKRWDDFINFHADMGDRPEGLTLDRINVNGNYEPDNCKWSTATEQRNNQRRK